jgi:hypothetical protein
MEGQGRDRTHGSVEPRDASRMRISDADRHQVSEVLRQAAGEGRIDLDELEERLEATYHAKTYAELVPITVDLPVRTPPTPTVVPGQAPVLAGPTYESSVAIMSETKRLGPWQVQDGHTAFALMGSVLLDLRDARLTGPELTINANAVMGEVKVLVDAGTVVVVEGIGIMGEFREQRSRVDAEITTDSPVVRVKGMALMGSVHVQRKGSSRKRLGR